MWVKKLLFCRRERENEMNNVREQDEKRVEFEVELRKLQNRFFTQHASLLGDDDSRIYEDILSFTDEVTQLVKQCVCRQCREVKAWKRCYFCKNHAICLGCFGGCKKHPQCFQCFYTMVPSHDCSECIRQDSQIAT